MTKVFCFAFAALFCFNAAGAINVVGSGNDSCGKWLNNRKTTSDWHQAGQWINGYYVAAQDLLPKDSLKKVDTYAMMSFVDKYCAENPLSAIYDATFPLLKELIQNK